MHINLENNKALVSLTWKELAKTSTLKLRAPQF